MACKERQGSYQSYSAAFQRTEESPQWACQLITRAVLQLCHISPRTNLKPSNVDQLNRFYSNTNMGLDLSLEEVKPFYSKSVTLTAPKLQFQLLNRIPVYLIQYACWGEGGERERGGEYCYYMFSSNRWRGTKESTHQETIKMNTFLVSS